jgi:serine/threonine protein kinase/tetratricopeptide (TPR) repeat protein
VETKQQWEKIKEVFGGALECNASGRAAFLDQACGDDRSLRQEVESLIKAHESSSNLWQYPLRPGPPDNIEGRFIGPYQLLKKIGEGGMGQVWLAQQTEPLQRKVALKLVRWGMYDDTLLHRFRSERQSLAVMDHPAIAKVFDAGATSEGQPYFVMEYVDGVPITDYCDQKKLNISDRLELLIKVCEGVQHAHQKAIIHRDLKPANILVTEVDGKPVPRIIDFGLAKAVNREITDGTVNTRVGHFVGTPGYMSPEQCDPGSTDVDTRTDVYSLGVILYVLLTGSLPFETKDWKDKPLEEILQGLRDRDPVRPSTKVSADRDTSLATAEARGTEPKQLAGALRGDLDWITMKAIEKDHTRRYASVTAFADDLRRYLKHEAISARPDTFSYRTAKFARRNRTAVALISAGLALVIGSLSIGLLIANRERKIAEQRFAQVRQLANRFIELDNEIRGLPGSTKVRMHMVSDSLQYLTLLGRDVHGDKDLALEIAYAYVRVAGVQGNPTSPNLGQFGEAEASLTRASGFVDPILAQDPTNPRALFIATSIAHDHMNLAKYRGDEETALKYAAGCADLIERFMNTRPTQPPDLYMMRYFYGSIASAYLVYMHLDDTIRYSQRGLNIPLTTSHGNGAILWVLGGARRQAGDLDGALKTADESIQLLKAEAADGHAVLLMNLANGYDLKAKILGRADAEPSLGRSDEALANFQLALDLAEDLAKKDPNDFLGRHHGAGTSLEIGNILRHHNPRNALAVYDHAIVRIREVTSNASTQRDEAKLLAASSYPARWMGHDRDAAQRIARAFELLTQAGRYPADKVEPMSDAYDVLRAQADHYAQTSQANKATEAYQDLSDRMMAWKLDLQNDLRDATCLSRTWTAQASLLRRAGRSDEANRLEAQRTELWNHWNGKLPNAQFLLRQSLSQIVPTVSLHLWQTNSRRDRPLWIVNPAKLSAERQSDVCAQCHDGQGERFLQPAFSYVPGQPLEKYIDLGPIDSAKDVDVHGKQGKLLVKSKCFQMSKNIAATCTRESRAWRPCHNIVCAATRCKRQRRTRNSVES